MPSNGAYVQLYAQIWQPSASTVLRVDDAFLYDDRLSVTIADNLDFLPFGEQTAGSSVTSHKFTGDERDSETTLDHTWFRQYSPLLGRWITPDPFAGYIEDPQSLNRYGYVLNNSLALVDPLGLDNDCPGGCTPFVIPVGGGCFIQVSYFKVKDERGDVWDMPWFTLVCTLTGGRNGQEGGGGGGGNGGGGGLTFGVRQPGQTFNQCMTANAKTYSMGGAADLTMNSIFGTNATVFSSGPASIVTGNAINGVLWGSVGDATGSMAGAAPDLIRAGMGSVTTMPGMGAPQALSSVTTRGVKSALGSVSKALSLGMSATVRWGIDIGLTAAEGIGCAVPASKGPG